MLNIQLLIYVCMCMDNCLARLFEMPLVQGLTSINMGNRDGQVQQLFQAGTVAQDYVVLIIMEIWDSFQVYCAVFQSVSIFFLLKFCSILKELDCIPFLQVLNNIEWKWDIYVCIYTYTYIKYIHIEHLRCVRHQTIHLYDK